MQPAVLAGLITYSTGHDMFLWLEFSQTFLTANNIGQLGQTKLGNVDMSDVSDMSTCLTCPRVWNVCEAGTGARSTWGLAPHDRKSLPRPPRLSPASASLPRLCQNRNVAILEIQKSTARK